MLRSEGWSERSRARTLADGRLAVIVPDDEYYAAEWERPAREIANFCTLIYSRGFSPAKNSQAQQL